MRISDWSSDVCSSDLCAPDRRYRSQIQGPGPLLRPKRRHCDPAPIAIAESLECWRGSCTGPYRELLSPARIDALCRYSKYRSEERRVGKECVSKCRSRRSTSTYKQQYIYEKCLYNITP